jgi:hypothetical protein
MSVPKTLMKVPRVSPRRLSEKALRSLLLCALSAAGVLEYAACSDCAAELAGSWLRNLLYNNKLRFNRHRPMLKLLHTYRPPATFPGKESQTPRVPGIGEEVVQ